MSEVVALGDFYFSQIVNKPIYDAANNKIGNIRDMAVRWDGNSPVVIGIKYAKNLSELIPVEMIENFDTKGVHLKYTVDHKKTITITEDDYYIGKWLLDQQLIDMQGYKLVRVNDIILSWILHIDKPILILNSVDIGVRGLFRRLGLEFLFNSLNNKYLSWQYITPLERRNSKLQITKGTKDLEKFHPADVADIIEELDYKRRAELLGKMDAHQVVDALTEMDIDVQVDIIDHLDEQLASDILEEMAPDDAADILSELSENKSEELLNLMESEEADDVRELMSYEEGTAGSLMTTEYLAFSDMLTAEETINKLRELAHEAETIYYIFVTDVEEHLQGVLSLRELIIAPPHTMLQDIMKTKIVSINHGDKQADVADMFKKYGLLAIPVVDEENILLGIVTIDDVIDILIPERSKSDAFSWFTITDHIRRIQ